MAIVEILSPMPGTVIEFLVQPGDRVDANQELLIVESMKMEVPVEASSAGVVRELLAEPGDSITEGQALVRLES